ncbi:MAG: class I SAM-dependent methyltransferase [Anaerolineales bacterium]|nr:class I SAM-dependent methyltransferase [Anaerolineales bacterium]NUQ85392.1 class I SAM-dependent methyltransferase [Anaerolineales bacterium]
METIRGRTSLDLNLNELMERVANYDGITLDLGTGDGRFVRCMAKRHHDAFFIGMDACRENLRAHSRIKLPNALFVIASAQALPYELNGLADRLTVNFPWGSLLESLLNGSPSLINRLDAVTRPRAGMEVCLNAEALDSSGWSLESGAERIERALNAAGWKTRSHAFMDARALRSFPTTWAKRLAFGRDPRAIRLSLIKG